MFRIVLALAATAIVALLTIFTVVPAGAGGTDGDRAYICPDGTVAMALGTQAAVDNPPVADSPMTTLPAPQTSIEVKDGTLAVNGGVVNQGELAGVTMYVCPTETKPSRGELIDQLEQKTTKLDKAENELLRYRDATVLLFIIGVFFGLGWLRSAHGVPTSRTEG